MRVFILLLFIVVFGIVAISVEKVAFRSPPEVAAYLLSPNSAQLLVDKSERKLWVYDGDNLLRSYSISLGSNPIGDKAKEGDRKTPEGFYRIDYRKKDSAFYLALRISYPDDTDKKEAAMAKISPGGDIFIHGSPNWWPSDSISPPGDWTAGCIALNNRDMADLWALIDVGTPIEIRP